MYYTKNTLHVLSLCAVLLLASCAPGAFGAHNNGNPATQGDGGNNFGNFPKIISFGFNVSCNPSLKTDVTSEISGVFINLTVPYGTDVRSLVATFDSTASLVKVGDVEQASGLTANDFESPVVYELSSTDGKTSKYKVVVNIARGDEKSITSFSVSGVAGEINETLKSISVVLPYGTDFKSIVAVFEITGISVHVGDVVQVSGVTANDFSGAPLIYIVTAADGSTFSYKVTVEGASWSTYQGDSSHTGYMPIVLDIAGFRQKWVTVGDRDPRETGPEYNPVVATKEHVIVSKTGYFIENQYIRVLNAGTGATVWEKKFENNSSTGAPAYHNGVAYIQTGKGASEGDDSAYLRAYDVQTGSLVFRSVIGAQWEDYYAPTIFGGNIYINGGTYGGCYSFSPAGAELWFAGLNQYDRWTPAVDNDYVYAYTGEYDPELTIMERSTGNIIGGINDQNFDWTTWSMDLAPVIGSQNDIIAINVLANSKGGRLIKFDLNQKKIAWELKENFSGQASAAKGVIYVVNAGALEARSESDGGRIWAVEPPGGEKFTGTILITDSHAILASKTNASPEIYTTRVVSLESRSIVWSYRGGYSPAWSNGVLYMITKDCSVVAVEAPVLQN